MQPTIIEPVNRTLSDLLISSKYIGTNALADAAASDGVDLFAVKTLAEITAAGLLTASIAREYGGQDLGLLPGTNLTLLTILKNIGSGNLVMGRVLEGHLNAQLLIHQFGSAEQQKRFAADAFAGHLFGVWNTQAKDGTILSPQKHNTCLLNGSKTFATGSGYVSRPLVTAALPDGSWQMCIVPLEAANSSSDATWWNPMGMRASRSYRMTFHNSLIPAANLLGEADIYYSQPGFSGGAVRFAAVQLGGAERLFEETRKYLQNLKRTEDPYQKMRVGQMAILIESGNQWLEGVAKQMDQYLNRPSAENSNRFLTYVNMMRTAVEQICVEVITLCQKCVGARGLNQPYHFERIIRDLSTYLRQPAPDAALAEVGKYVLKSTLPATDLWISNHKK